MEFYDAIVFKIAVECRPDQTQWIRHKRSLRSARSTAFERAYERVTSYELRNTKYEIRIKRANEKSKRSIFLKLTKIICLLMIIWSPFVFAKVEEPMQSGAYFGSIPSRQTDKIIYQAAYFTSAWADNEFIEKQGFNDWVFKAKKDLIDSALNQAKIDVTKSKLTHYAIDNMRFQVVHTNARVEIFFDCNLIGWN